MKKLILSVVVLAMIMASCKDESSVSPEESYAEFSISANDADVVTLKSSVLEDAELPKCDDLIDYENSYSYATITYMIGDAQSTVDVPVFNLNGKFVTEPIKVMMGDDESVEVVIKEFLVYSAEDVLLKATPHEGSDFYSFIDPNYGLRSFTIRKFDKIEYRIDVLCYDDLTYEYFGFTWVDIIPLTVRSLCVYGDICICEPGSYMLSYVDGDVTYSYAEQIQGESLYDVIAYTKVIITQEDGTVREFTNLGESINDCLPVYWSDYDNIADEVTFELQVLLPVGDALEWVTVKTITDEAGADFGQGDDMIDFVIGDCHESADWVLPGHLHLPGDEVTVKMTVTDYLFTEATAYHYMNVLLSEVPEGYSIGNGNYKSWCVDRYHSITLHKEYSGVHIYAASEWDPVDTNLDRVKLDRLNYMINHLPDELKLELAVDPVFVGKKLQLLMWWITEGSDAEGGFSLTEGDLVGVRAFLDEINENVTEDVRFIPDEAGMKHAIIFFINNEIQILFTPVMSPCVEVFA